MSNALVFVDIETLPDVSTPGAYDAILEKLVNPYKLKSKAQEWEETTKFKEADETYRKQALEPWEGEIVCISWAINDQPVQGIVRDPMIDSEKDFLVMVDRLIYEGVMESGATPAYSMWVGHNLQFDIGWIQKRLMKYQVKGKMPYPVNPKPLGDRNFYCTMANAAGWGGRVSLNKLARFFGLGSKIADGGAVYDMYKEDRFEDILKYCMSDVDLTREVYRHLNYYYAE